MRIPELLLGVVALLLLASCGQREEWDRAGQLAIRVRFEISRAWDADRNHAGGGDSRMPVEAFSTLVITGLTGAADEVVSYTADSVHFEEDLVVKVLKTNVRTLGGLVSMYQLSGDERILERAVDLGDRLLPAFRSPTGLPFDRVNLGSGIAEGSQVNVSGAGTYLLEMGMLSYFSGNPGYYAAAKRSSRAIFERRSDIGLVGEVIDVETGEWINPASHIGPEVASYYEYLYKGWLLFGDHELKAMWDASIGAVMDYLPMVREGKRWFGKVNMHSGEHTASTVKIGEASFPGLLALSGYYDESAALQDSWNWLWNLHGVAPLAYDVATGAIPDPAYNLNPEIIESAWYLWKKTGELSYRKMIMEYFQGLDTYCSTGMGFTALKSVITREKRDHFDPYLLFGTLKYLYLSFAVQDMYQPGTAVFTAGDHPFLRAALDGERLKKHLKINETEQE